MIRFKVTRIEKDGFKTIQDVVEYFNPEVAIIETNRILSNKEILTPLIEGFKKEGEKNE